MENINYLDKYTVDLIWFFNKWTNFSNKEILKYNLHKLRHTIWVLEKWQDIFLLMEEQKKDIKNLIKVGFLLHDIWRFFQNNWNKILDWNEFEHADRAYHYIKNYYKEDENYIIIALAVKYHNKLKINNLFHEKEYLKMSDNDKKLCIFIAKLLRDADKLHNMLHLIYYDLDDELYFNFVNIENNISLPVFEAFLNKNVVNINNVKTLSDYILIYLSWLFDINFKETYSILRFYNYKEKVLQKLWKYIDLNNEYKQIVEILKDF